MTVSKFFTPPLSPADREQVYRLLGLDRFRYAFAESCGGTVLRTHLHRDGGRTPIFSVPADVPVFARRHEGQQLALQSLTEPLSFWEELFPHPFREVGRWFRENDGAGFHVEPRSLVPSLHGLWKACEALEARMKEDEIGCLWLSRRTPGQWEEMPLLCHYVRRRRVRLGNGWRWGGRDNLVGLGELHRRGELSPDVLRSRLGGARATFHYLDSSDFLPGPSPIAELVTSLQQLLQATSPPQQTPEEAGPERVSRPSTGTAPTPFEL